MDKLLALLGSEPVRARIYPLLTVLVAYLVGRGILSADLSQYVLAALAAALGVGGVEYARAKVTPCPPKD